jgi:tripartite-type tricarboxylate transporter receptor subunit TctC
MHVFAAVALLIGASAIMAQPYPSKSVKLIVHFPVGSTTDQTAGIGGKELQEVLPQPFVVDSKLEISA